MNSKQVDIPEIEKQLLNYIFHLDFNDLSQNSVQYCKMLILDSLGVALPGSQAPGCAETLDMLVAWETANGSTLLFSDRKIPPPFAAFGNSMMMHALDFDDTFDDSALHTFVSVLPAALATAEQVKDVSGKMLITSLVAGVELICRVSRAIHRPLSWIRTSTCGAFGAAVTAGKILGLNKEELLNALGIVYSQVSGNAQGLIEGRLVKRMQPGFAAKAGVFSALLAKSGMTGSRHFLTGPYGYFHLYEQDECDPAAVLDMRGKDPAINDLSIKPYPCCRMTHSSIDAVLNLKDKVPALEGVKEIRVSVSKMVKDMVGRPFSLGTDPQVSAQFSIPYTLSVALLKGDVFLQDFETDSIVEDKEILSLAEKVKVQVNPDLKDKDIMQSRIEVQMREGSRITEDNSAPSGNPLKPLQMKQVKEKFEKCLNYSGLDFEREKIDSIISMLESLDDLQECGHLVTQLKSESSA